MDPGLQIDALNAAAGARQRDSINQQLAIQNNLLAESLNKAEENKKKLNQLFNFKILILELSDLVATYPQNQREIFKKILDAKKVHSYTNSFAATDFYELHAKELAHELFKYLHDISTWAETAISPEIRNEEIINRRQEELDRIALDRKPKKGILFSLLRLVGIGLLTAVICIALFIGVLMILGWLSKLKII